MKNHSSGFFTSITAWLISSLIKTQKSIKQSFISFKNFSWDWFRQWCIMCCVEMRLMKKREVHRGFWQMSDQYAAQHSVLNMQNSILSEVHTESTWWELFRSYRRTDGSNYSRYSLLSEALIFDTGHSSTVWTKNKCDRRQ